MQCTFLGLDRFRLTSEEAATCIHMEDDLSKKETRYAWHGEYFWEGDSTARG